MELAYFHHPAPTEKRCCLSILGKDEVSNPEVQEELIHFCSQYLKEMEVFDHLKHSKGPLLPVN